MDGAVVGASVDIAVGASIMTLSGLDVGSFVTVEMKVLGVIDGVTEGLFGFVVGIDDGFSVGFVVGNSDGIVDGVKVGSIEGERVGINVGGVVGSKVGSDVGFIVG